MLWLASLWFSITIETIRSRSNGRVYTNIKRRMGDCCLKSKKENLWKVRESVESVIWVPQAFILLFEI